jgi:hypothetical protein
MAEPDRPPAVPGPAAPQQLVRIVCQPGAPAGKDIALDGGRADGGREGLRARDAADLRRQPGAAAQPTGPAGVKKAAAGRTAGRAGGRADGRAGGRAGGRADAGGRARGRGQAQQAAAQPCGEGEVVELDP